jgi:exoribonuclease R
MVTYTLNVKDRSYNSWQITDVNNNNVALDIHPFEAKLFANDVFIVEKLNKVTLMKSPIRSGPPISGVLILAGNKTYGRQNNVKGNGKLLYKCIPDDIQIPPFLIPYEVKSMGFLKCLQNLYVTFTFDDWQDKHPRGKLDNVIGEVDILDRFYEYQLFCKKLNVSMNKFQKDTSKALEMNTGSTSDGVFEIIKTKYPSIQDRTDWRVITIDPPTSLDFDDGFSLIEDDDGTQQLSIYISNVTIWLDVLNLWNSFSKRISTIYLPDKKRPMLPTILSDGLCSLQENAIRVAFVMDIFIKKNEITDIKYANCFVKVAKNYAYEEPKLLANLNYQRLLDLTRIISIKNRYIENIADSHDMVCYLMIFMNYHCAKQLMAYKTGVFRSTIMKKDFSVPDTIPTDVGKMIKIMNSASGQYIDGAQMSPTRHEILELDAYIHITSPIRRIVDVLNMIKIQQLMGMDQLSEDAYKFYSKWIDDIDYINVTTRAIRKVQNECSLIELCSNKPDLMEKEYEGYITEKNTKDNGLFQYNVFLPDLKLSALISTTENFEVFDCKKFKLFLFNNEEKFKRKIRIHMV